MRAAHAHTRAQHARNMMCDGSGNRQRRDVGGCVGATLHQVVTLSRWRHEPSVAPSALCCQRRHVGLGSNILHRTHLRGQQRRGFVIARGATAWVASRVRSLLHQLFEMCGTYVFVSGHTTANRVIASRGRVREELRVPEALLEPGAAEHRGRVESVFRGTRQVGAGPTGRCPS